ncbi:predicted protein [Brucella abortus bv. 4 str. 292]|uniref:Uncharacterized protein n=3 Tax=Brucella TaxID=234 RepID=A0A7U8K6P8_BRUNE|nr:predicted protein [Brucella abortus bv. 4 str. 292]EEX60813.1 predicted protein [Brucella abortus bv. 2 str. 86/8/59]EEX63828.1 predicted protein [Brucella abortus bv. 6 str. 870]EEX79311.1 predicted protein [Brucella abortus bv. 9 str. C68]EEX84253.1 predicted protein [Brucella abortus bv. 3 str. Tulya]EEX85366.1 predicted protein [Brucella ceti B1/94]EEX88571.1 predicted protein [Brucella ceti M13/05/1]EEX95969.1 predicted protein [Brucella ceti M644/93/1]EEY02932.1 predicted protein [
MAMLARPKAAAPSNMSLRVVVMVSSYDIVGSGAVLTGGLGPPDQQALLDD